LRRRHPRFVIGSAKIRGVFIAAKLLHRYFFN
jgi:hypothetical protein